MIRDEEAYKQITNIFQFLVLGQIYLKIRVYLLADNSTLKETIFRNTD
jgi:hypothetical protein